MSARDAAWMSRRDLLKLFGVAAVSLALPGPGESAEGPPLDLEPYVDALDLGPYVGAFSAFGVGVSSRWAKVGLRRGTADLLNFGVNEFGGILHWVPPASERLRAPASHPVTIWSESPLVEAHALIVLGRGELQVLSSTRRDAVTVERHEVAK